MPVQCSESVLTGADGLVTFAPLGSSVCLLAADFTGSSTDTIAIGVANFKVGDPVVFTEEGGATLDGGLTAGDTYYIVSKTGTGDATVVTVSETAGGAKVTLSADGEDNGGHVNMTYEGTEAICSVQDWSLSLTKGQTDVTTLPCTVNCSGGSKVAPVRKQQGTFLEGEGTMNIMFTGDTTSPGMKLLQGSIMTDSRVYAKLYINAICGAGDVVDDSASLYYAGYVNLLGFSITVNTTDAIVAAVNFAVADTPDAIFGVTV